jgi:hypothetical protein
MAHLPHFEFKNQVFFPFAILDNDYNLLLLINLDNFNLPAFCFGLAELRISLPSKIIYLL